jgi:hypothetical protein
MGKPQPPADAPGNTSVMLRFFSVRECIMAKRYFDLRCGFDGMACFVQDCADRELSHLDWDHFPRVGESGKQKRQRLRVNARQNISNSE